MYKCSPPKGHMAWQALDSSPPKQFSQGAWSVRGIPCFWNHSGIWNLSYKAGLTSLWTERCFRSGKITSISWKTVQKKINEHVEIRGPEPLNDWCPLSVTWSSECCPAENGTQGIPFKGCRMKLNGLLSTMTILLNSFDRQERSFTCSLYSLKLYTPTDIRKWTGSLLYCFRLLANKYYMHYQPVLLQTSIMYKNMHEQIMHADPRKAPSIHY